MLQIEELITAQRGVFFDEGEQSEIQTIVAQVQPVFQWTETDPTVPGVYLNSTTTTPDGIGSAVNVYRVELRPSSGNLELHIQDQWYQFNNAYQYWLGPLNLLPHGQLIPGPSFT